MSHRSFKKSVLYQCSTSLGSAESSAESGTATMVRAQQITHSATELLLSNLRVTSKRPCSCLLQSMVNIRSSEDLVKCSKDRQQSKVTGKVQEEDFRMISFAAVGL